MKNWNYSTTYPQPNPQFDVRRWASNSPERPERALTSIQQTQFASWQEFDEATEQMFGMLSKTHGSWARIGIFFLKLIDSMVVVSVALLISSIFAVFKIANNALSFAKTICLRAFGVFFS